MSHGGRRSQTWTLARLGIRVPKLKRHRVGRKHVRLKSSNDDDDDDDDDDELVHKLRWPRSFISSPVAAVLILVTLWVCLYCGSLAGGDLHTVITHLGNIAACFFSAVACFLAALYVAAFTPGIPTRTRVALLVTVFASWNLLLLYDHGGTLRRHGAYNMLVFVVFVVPAVCMGALEYALLRVMGWRKLAALHVPVMLLAGSATTRSLQIGIDLWDRGFRGERIAPATTCAPVNRGLPWVDVIPAGAQNFWAGTRSCSDLAKFHVNFTMDGAIDVSCSSATRRTYTPLPSTLDWPKDAKRVEEVYEGALSRPLNKRVMEKIREAGEVAYATPLPPGTESLIVRCGAAEQLVARVRPSTAALSRTPSSTTKLDVVILFLDATSRRAFHRRLSRTVAALEDADARGATRLYQFFRYNVMSFCTDANSRAMFQGCSRPASEWVSPLWEDFGRSGWVTLYTADTCQDLNAAYLNKAAPEDRRCFDHELIAPFCHADFFPEDANPYGNFKGPYSITARCLMGKHVHAHALNYLDSFRDAYPRRARFSLAWFLEGHEGTTEVLRYLDDDLAAFVSTVDWNRTILVVAADHGLHMGINFGLFRNGAVEHKNPMLAVMLPPWYVDQEGRHEKMVVNQQRLVTGLDLYRTLQGIRLAGSKEMDEAEEERSKSGIDLLQKAVPENRTCIDAEIPETWCQCL